MLSWEKPLVKPMAPGIFIIILHLFYLHSISFTILQSLLSILYNKNTKNIYFTIFIRSHLCEWPWRDWQPLYRVGCKVLDCLCRCCLHSVAWFSYWFDNLDFITEGNTYRWCAASSLPLRGNPTQAQAVARRISGAVAGESTQKVNIPSTHHNPYLSHYIICHLPLVFLSPTSPLSFYSPFLSILPLYLPFCLPVCWIACLSLCLKLGRLSPIWGITMS